MRKLSKNTSIVDNSIETYACVCGCGCACNCSCFLGIGSANNKANDGAQAGSSASIVTLSLRI